MSTEHPITPPPELLQQWRKSGPADAAANNAYERHIAAQAARWGADQELEACCEWIADNSLRGAESDLLKDLRAARRPKPPSVAEQALDALEQVDEWAVANMSQLAIHDDLVAGVETIRAALERLQELENND